VLSIGYIDNGKAHEDVLLKLGGVERVCDSYYFALDTGIRPGDGSPFKVGLVLIRLIEQWSEIIETANNGSTVYLPFDFSDQYTGCIRCEVIGDTCELHLGFSRREGWSMLPSNIIEYSHSVSDFALRSEEVESIKISKEDLLGDLRASKSRIREQWNPNGL
jgi:hypothetical protein